MRRLLILLPLIITFLCAGTILPDDPFRGIQCDSDVVKTLTGRRMGKETSKSMEERHKDIGLADLGGDMVSDELFLGSWKICNQEYLILIDNRDIISDVLKFLEHSKQTPEFIGECEVNGVHKSDVIVAVLDNAAGKGLLPAKAAWMINKKTKKFVKVPTEKLLCPRNGIITAD